MQKTQTFAIRCTFIALIIIFSLNSSLTYASSLPYMPPAGELIGLSAPRDLPLPVAIEINKNPFDFTFTLSRTNNTDKEFIQQQAQRIAKYFFSALTLPAKELWVNLSPHEPDRIMTDSTAATELGRDLLGEDYVLKQLAASLTYPETDTGKKYWQQATKGALGKIWIVPGAMLIHESNGKAVIIKARLKVESEKDFAGAKELLPLIEQEVNHGERFARLRQVYYAVMLAGWFKRKLQNTVCSQNYFEQKKVSGAKHDDPSVKTDVYKSYLEAFKKGAYDYVKNERMVKRRYFCGGARFASALTAPVAKGDTRVDGSIVEVVSSPDIKRTSSYGNVPESLRQQLDEEISRSYVQAQSVLGLSEGRILTEKEADRAAVRLLRKNGITGITENNLSFWRDRVRKSGFSGKEIFFTLPFGQDGHVENLWHLDDYYAAAHCNGAMDRLHISLSYILSGKMDEVLGRLERIAVYEEQYRKKVQPQLDSDDARALELAADADSLGGIVGYALIRTQVMADYFYARAAQDKEQFLQAAAERGMLLAGKDDFESAFRIASESGMKADFPNGKYPGDLVISSDAMGDITADFGNGFKYSIAHDDLERLIIAQARNASSVKRMAYASYGNVPAEYATQIDERLQYFFSQSDLKHDLTVDEADKLAVEKLRANGVNIDEGHLRQWRKVAENGGLAGRKVYFVPAYNRSGHIQNLWDVRGLDPAGKSHTFFAGAHWSKERNSVYISIGFLLTNDRSHYPVNPADAYINDRVRAIARYERANFIGGVPRLSYSERMLIMLANLNDIRAKINRHDRLKDYFGRILSEEEVFLGLVPLCREVILEQVQHYLNNPDLRFSRYGKGQLRSIIAQAYASRTRRIFTLDATFFESSSRGPGMFKRDYLLNVIRQKDGSVEFYGAFHRGADPMVKARKISLEQINARTGQERSLDAAQKVKYLTGANGGVGLQAALSGAAVVIEDASDGFDLDPAWGSAGLRGIDFKIAAVEP